MSVDPIDFQGTSRFTRPRTKTERVLRSWAWMGIDILACIIAARLASFLAQRDLEPLQWLVLAGIATLQIAVHYQRGLYRTVLRYVGYREFVTIAIGTCVGIITAVVVCYFLRMPNTGGLGRVILVLYGFFVVSLSMGSRALYRFAFEQRKSVDSKRVVILGSGSLGEIVLRELRNQPDHVVVGFLDNLPARHGEQIRGVRVLGALAHLPTLHHQHRFDLLIIAERMLPQHDLKYAFQLSMELGIQVKRVQGMALGRTGSVQIEDIALEDLLRRPPRNLDHAGVSKLITGRCVLVTGAGGSIGSELCHQIARDEPAHLVLVDHSEFNLYQIDGDLSANYPHLRVTPILATLTDRGSVDAFIANYHPDLVFHAAAYKHVPMVEENPFLGMSNNVGGFFNLLDACIVHGVPQLVAISTDKAVRPTNIMGASKRICEVLLQNCDSSNTRLSAVRFGNVLGSSGSVIPRFLEQIRRGGPVTVTDPEVTRYFMLLPEAVELVLHASAIAQDGQILILDMGAPVKIVNLARQLIFMTGNRPDVDIRIAFTGLRPGEKLTEELLLGDSESSTTIEGITIATPSRRDHSTIRSDIVRLLTACQARDLSTFIELVRKLVPEWNPSTEFAAIIDGTTDQIPALTNIQSSDM